MHAFVPGARELPQMTAYGLGNGTIHIAELDDHYFRQREDDLWRSGLIGRPERLMLEPKSVRQSSALEGCDSKSACARYFCWLLSGFAMSGP